MYASPSKTLNQTVKAWGVIAQGTNYVSSAVDVSSAFCCVLFIRLAHQDDTAFTSGWPICRVEASYKSSGNNSWVPLRHKRFLQGSSRVYTTLTQDTDGSNVIVVSSATGISVGQTLFLPHYGNGYFDVLRVKSISGTSITCEEVITNSYVATGSVSGPVYLWMVAVDTTGIGNIRATVDNVGNGTNIVVEIMASICTSIG